MKKFATALVCMLVVYSLCAFVVPRQLSAVANDSFRLYLDDRLLETQSPPQLVNNTMLVPLRIVSEELGAEVKWDQAQKSITVHKGELNLQLGIDKQEALVNGQTQLLDAAPVLMNRVTLIPVRFVSENLGLIVQWDSQNQSVLLKSTSQAADAVNGANNLSEINRIEMDGNTLLIATTGGSMKPAVSKMSDPARVVIDIPDAALGRSVNGQENGGQGGKIYLNHPYVSNIRFSLFQKEPSTVRIVLDLQQDIAYESKTGEAANEWLLTLNSGSLAGEVSLESVDSSGSIDAVAPVDPSNPVDSSKPVDSSNPVDPSKPVDSSNPVDPSKPVDSSNPVSPVPGTGSQLPDAGPNKYKVVIDAGHGGSDAGTIAASGKYEKDFNLPMALKVAELLGKNDRIAVQMTRSDDTYPGLSARAVMANDWKADVFVSIHGNSFTENRAVTGTETHYTREDSKPLADIIHRHFLEGTGFKDRGVIKSNLAVTRQTTMPAVLLEVGFLSNPQQEQTMWDEQFQWKVAQSIVDGIMEFLQVAK